MLSCPLALSPCNAILFAQRVLHLRCGGGRCFRHYSLNMWVGPDMAQGLMHGNNFWAICLLVRLKQHTSQWENSEKVHGEPNQTNYNYIAFSL